MKRATIICAIIIALATIATVLPWAWAAIQQISGIAVQGSSIQWNNVKDASQGDNLTSGIIATGLFGYDGSNWDRLRASADNGLLVDVKRVQGTMTVAGNVTPNANYPNPSNATVTYALAGVRDSGGLWDPIIEPSSDSMGIDGIPASGLMGFNGASWDRLRSSVANGLQVDVTRIQGTPNVTTAASSTVTTGQVTVDNTATLITAADPSRRSLMVRNIGIVDVYIGSNTVTATTGYLLKANESIVLNRNTAAIYGIVGTGSTTIAYLKE